MFLCLALYHLAGGLFATVCYNWYYTLINSLRAKCLIVSVIVSLSIILLSIGDVNRSSEAFGRVITVYVGRLDILVYGILAGARCCGGRLMYSTIALCCI